MYATPTLKPLAMDAETSSCCDVFVNSQFLIFNFRNPACGPVIRQFPTCGIQTQPPLPSAPLCTVTVQSDSFGTVGVSGY
jgi:hypothetical protein